MLSLLRACFIVSRITQSAAEPLQPLPRLLELVRDHWAIENRLHWRCDVTLREDHCQVRKGDALHVLAVLNSFLLALMDFLGVSNMPQQMRLLLGSLLTGK